MNFLDFTEKSDVVRLIGMGGSSLPVFLYAWRVRFRSQVSLELWKSQFSKNSILAIPLYMIVQVDLSKRVWAREETLK